MVAMGGFGTALYTGKQREGNGLGEMGILSLYDVTTYGAGRVMGYRGDARKAGRLDTSSAAADWRCRGDLVWPQLRLSSRFFFWH